MISITLPSLYPNSLMRTLNNIRDTSRSEPEIIVVSPFEPPAIGNILWVKETSKLGANAAHMAAMERVTGEFITGWVDDHLYTDGWDQLVLDDFLEREAVFHSRNPDKPFVLGLRHIEVKHVGTEFGIYYPYFPLMRTNTARTFGWFTDEYQVGFADSDLAMRIWSAGGRCEWSASGIVTFLDDEEEVQKQATIAMFGGAHCMPDDMKLFLAKWASKYGVGWDTSSLRSFNIDVTPERFPEFMDETKRTIYYNDPHFKDVVDSRGKS